MHGLPALRQMPGNKWLEVGLIRMNHNGTRMDGPTYEDTNHPDNVSEVVDHIQQVKNEGLGVISMKLCGGGKFEHSHDDRVKRCGSLSRMPGWIAPRWASRARRRSTKPSTT